MKVSAMSVSTIREYSWNSIAVAHKNMAAHAASWRWPSGAPDSPGARAPVTKRSMSTSVPKP